MNIPGATGVLRATVTVTRRDGTKQEYQLVGAATPEQVRELLKGQHDGGNALDGSEKRSD